MRILAYLRKKKGWTQEELAKMLNSSRSRISDYEQGRSQPDFYVLKELSRIFEVSIDALIKDDWNEEQTEDSKYFAFALYDEAKDLTPEQKEDLLEMIKIMKKRNEKEK